MGVVSPFGSLFHGFCEAPGPVVTIAAFVEHKKWLISGEIQPIIDIVEFQFHNFRSQPLIF
jgi:hypothetical protein